MAFRPEDHVVAELRYAIYAAIALHFLRKILGKVFVRDERVPWKSRYYVVEIRPEDLVGFDLALSKKYLHRDKEITPSILEEVFMRWSDGSNRCPDVINRKN
jgi:hypothetical protein